MAARKPVFVDTSGWIALLNQDDERHLQASELLRRFGKEQRVLMTTDWILAETGNGLARTKARSQYVALAETFLQSAHGRLIKIDDGAWRDALKLYKQFDDKTWGMVDCASFVIMRNHQLRDALTADQHFQQAGFRRLLR